MAGSPPCSGRSAPRRRTRLAPVDGRTVLWRTKEDSFPLRRR
jgi:hypothetical protein